MAVHLQNQINLESSFLRQDAGKNFMELSDIFPPIQKLVNQMASASIKEQTISYSVITENDVDAVIQLLKDTFFKDEPLNYYLQLGECKDLEEYCKKSIPDACSYKAVNSNGDIVGVYLNGIIRKPSDDDVAVPLASKTSHEKFKIIMQLMDYIDTKFSIFDLYPDIDAFIDGKILAVDPRYRGKNIAGRLTDYLIEFMKKNNYKIFHVLCTSHFSARVCEKMDFKEVFTLRFDEYLVDGKQVLCPEKPHVAARIFVKEIN
ncbi:arylalkylamine N-acetyltransferase 1 isoform X1 [Chironomus tepperi]|uniref:arylalkylamine N-acetyltransferase 1 isoform X1 n=2 Tax=Chironomus tepperi TaxID=113505 RepID=UPI00391F68EA